MAATHELQEDLSAVLPEGALEARPEQRRMRWLPVDRLRRLGPHLPVVASMIAYSIYYSRLTVDIHQGYGTPAYDMGIFDQGIWLLSRFKAPFVTIMGRNLFADHTSFIL